MEDQNEDDDFLGFTKVLADMLNRLSYHNFIPQTAIDIIIQNYLSLSNKAMEMRKLRMLKIMKEKSIPSDVIPDLMATLEYDESYEAHKLLSTTFKSLDQLLITGAPDMSQNIGWENKLLALPRISVTYRGLK